MTTETLSPRAKQQFFDNNGLPANNYRIFTYQAGTTTKLTSYKDQSGTTNSNPITLNPRGECDLWIPPNIAYKYVFTYPGSDDPPTATIWTVDNIINSQLVSLYGGVDSGVANAYILNFTAPFTSYVDGTVIYWIPAQSNTTASTININSFGGVPIINPDNTPLIAGQIVAGQPVGMMFFSGSFIILASVTNGTFTATLTGMTAATTGTVSYSRVGKIITLTGPVAGITGTSNTNGMTMTGLPASVTPANLRGIFCGELVDNTSSDPRNCGTAEISNTGIITFSLLVRAGVLVANFTNAGSKGIASGWTISYSL
jgi:hypothetical protein